jgi:flagellar protein FliO/FliZ
MTSGLARGFRALVAVMFFLTTLSPALAANQAVPPVSISPLVSSLQMLFGLGVVLAAIAATAWLLRRLAPGQVGSAENMRVVAAVAVGPKERVVLVDVGDTRLVLGVAPGLVTRLHEMPRPDDADSQQPPLTITPVVSRFKEMLAARKGIK